MRKFILFCFLLTVSGATANFFFGNVEEIIPVVPIFSKGVTLSAFFYGIYSFTLDFILSIYSMGGFSQNNKTTSKKGKQQQSYVVRIFKDGNWFCTIGSEKDSPKGKKSGITYNMEGPIEVSSECPIFLTN